MEKNDGLELIRDQFMFETAWQLCEAKDDPVVDGKHILGRIRGQGFIVDGASENGRYYKRKLWSKVITENQKNMDTGLMLGTIGHDQELDDKALREGKASHRVVKLWIDENDPHIGMIEALILGSTAGKELNVYFRGGVRLATSSRAYGKFKGKVSTPAGEAQAIDPDTFRLETFDFVKIGGVKGANPELVEGGDAPVIVEKEPVVEDVSTADIEQEQETIEEVLDMDNKETKESKMLENLVTEKTNIQADLDRVLVDNEDLKGKLAVAKDKMTALEETLKEYKELGKAGDISKKLELLETAQKESVTLQAMVTDLSKTTASYKEVGSPEEVNQALEGAKKLAESLKELGTVAELNEALDVLQKYTDLGAPDEINEAFEKTKEFVEKISELGTPEDIEGVMDLAESFLELGTPEEFEKVLELTGKIVEDMKKTKRTQDVKAVAEALGITEKNAEKLIDNTGTKEAAIETGNMMRENFGLEVSKRYEKKDEDGEKGEKDEKDEEISESKKSITSTSRGGRMMNQFSR